MSSPLPGVLSNLFASEEAVKAINQHARDNRFVEEGQQWRPLFLYLAFAAVHNPVQAPESYVNMYANKRKWGHQRKVYAGMLTQVDDAVKGVVAALKGTGMWNDTLIVVTTDNGARNIGCADDGARTVCGPMVRLLPCCMQYFLFSSLLLPGESKIGR